MSDNKRQIAFTGLVCLAAVAVAGIAFSGRGKNISKNAKEIISESKNSIDYFKNKTGFFKNGKAFLNNGTPYSGEMEHIRADGKQFVLKFENGMPITSIQKSPEGIVERTKNYSTVGERRIIEIFGQDADGVENLLNKTILTDDSVRKYKSDRILDKWFQKVDGIWKRVDSKVDKNGYNEYIDCETFYLYHGRPVNHFLRNGEFLNYHFENNRLPDSIPDSWSSYEIEIFEKAKRDNRTLLEIIDKLDDAVHSSRINSRTTVYRRAPQSWMSTEKNGFITDRGYCSTSLDPEAYFGYLWDIETKDNPLYEIVLPQGTPFLNMTGTEEKEVLLPRNGLFKVIGDRKLLYSGEIRN